jgi:glycosyltransferase involved in cell wall biosynthesis
MPPKLSVVIPVYNERRTIEEVLRRVQAVDIDKEIIVVDDGSTDGTSEFLQRLQAAREQGHRELRLAGDDAPIRLDNLRILFQGCNRGKGAALRRGFAEATGEIVIIQDADFEYDPQDYHGMITPITRGVADVVYGSRFLGGPHRVLFFWHFVGNKILTLLSNMVTNLNLSDVWTCYKAFRRDVLMQLRLREDRFGIEQEMTVKVARLGVRVYEVPIAYYGRTYAEGKKITWRDGLRGIWCIVRYGLLGARVPASSPGVYGEKSVAEVLRR